VASHIAQLTACVDHAKVQRNLHYSRSPPTDAAAAADDNGDAPLRAQTKSTMT
jgi:hypothetical protein